ncbi:MAG: 5-formyltetrahydrofolate cyclo-ligase [Ancrocorticia sp.]|uniref:5-formyltetrahydrofolate cyclo-ligase n=1 Tax=Ancrocorticia sp. TaxID=2593684 RepID=UPI003F924DAE
MEKHMVALPDVTGLDVEDAKQALRSVARDARKRLPVAVRKDFEAQWVPTALDFIGDAKTVACYVSVNNEPETHALCEAIAAHGCELLLPKLGPGLSREWAWYQGADDLAVCAPGRPPEPSGEAIGSDILATVDVLIIPATLVDRQGRRIGQGGGWYDRVLKQVSAQTRVGAMVFPEEYVDIDLPQDPMDRPVSFVILPDRWGACGKA